MSFLKFVFGMPFSLRQRRLESRRPPMSKQEFVERVASSEIGKSAASKVWEKLLDAAAINTFIPYPDDDILYTYGLADEDLDEDIILEILDALNRAVPSKHALRISGPIKSAADIVRLVESQPNLS